jgi:membrane protein involved in colicin uptake
MHISFLCFPYLQVIQWGMKVEYGKTLEPLPLSRYDEKNWQISGQDGTNRLVRLDAFVDGKRERLTQNQEIHQSIAAKAHAGMDERRAAEAKGAELQAEKDAETLRKAEVAAERERAKLRAAVSKQVMEGPGGAAQAEKVAQATKKSAAAETRVEDLRTGTTVVGGRKFKKRVATTGATVNREKLSKLTRW